MTQPNDGGPAFPQDLQGRRGDDPQYQGMSLRDWFAGQVLQGLASNEERWVSANEVIAKACYEAADAMLKARSANE